MSPVQFLGVIGALVIFLALMDVFFGVRWERKVWEIEDGEETCYYSSVSATEACLTHRSLYGGGDYPCNPLCLREVTPGEWLTVVGAGPNGETIVRTAREWAAMEEGLISASTF